MIKDVIFPKNKPLGYPFDIKAFNKVESLDLNHQSIIFVGDNGSGKSTLLKALAHHMKAINVSHPNQTFFTSVIPLSDQLHIATTARDHQSLFFSGEDFITYINYVKKMKVSLQSDIDTLSETYKDKNDYAKSLLLGPFKKELYALNSAFKKALETQSHGEGFLFFFKARFHDKAIYFLDEPETPLSPINQYQLLVLLYDLTQSGAQVIIATHSPILMALPNAKIYQFSEIIQKINYDDIEHVTFLRHFLNDPERFTHNL
ncbi:MAG: AAA family ATPase [Candidatus Izemoplasma sp.]|nr:AAA family ATPase [Candidatus Izemoplasma sp.]